MSEQLLANLGKAVQEVRLGLGFSIEEAAERGGSSHVTWRRVERGQTVKKGTYYAVDKAFDLDTGTTHRVAEGRLQASALLGEQPVQHATQSDAVSGARRDGLASAVKERRRHLRLTQEQVANRGGPSVATLRIIERATGDADLRESTLAKLDSALYWEIGTCHGFLFGAQRPTSGDPLVKSAAEVAPAVLGEYIGVGVAAVLSDHELDEYPDPNIHELAWRVLALYKASGGAR
jgi:transcriptional regulator with XRE-family HTH domain